MVDVLQNQLLKAPFIAELFCTVNLSETSSSKYSYIKGPQKFQALVFRKSFEPEHVFFARSSVKLRLGGNGNSGTTKKAPTLLLKLLTVINLSFRLLAYPFSKIDELL